MFIFQVYASPTESTTSLNFSRTRQALSPRDLQNTLQTLFQFDVHNNPTGIVVSVPTGVNEHSRPVYLIARFDQAATTRIIETLRPLSAEQRSAVLQTWIASVQTALIANLSTSVPLPESTRAAPISTPIIVQPNPPVRTSSPQVAVVTPTPVARVVPQVTLSPLANQIVYPNTLTPDIFLSADPHDALLEIYSKSLQNSFGGLSAEFLTYLDRTNQNGIPRNDTTRISRLQGFVDYVRSNPNDYPNMVSDINNLDLRLNGDNLLAARIAVLSWHFNHPGIHATLPLRAPVESPVTSVPATRGRLPNPPQRSLPQLQGAQLELYDAVINADPMAFVRLRANHPNLTQNDPIFDVIYQEATAGHLGEFSRRLSEYARSSTPGQVGRAFLLNFYINLTDRTRYSSSDQSVLHHDAELLRTDLGHRNDPILNPFQLLADLSAMNWRFNHPNDPPGSWNPVRQVSAPTPVTQPVLVPAPLAGLNIPIEPPAHAPGYRAVANRSDAVTSMVNSVIVDGNPTGLINRHPYQENEVSNAALAIYQDLNSPTATGVLAERFRAFVHTQPRAVTDDDQRRLLLQFYMNQRSHNADLVRDLSLLWQRFGHSATYYPPGSSSVEFIAALATLNWRLLHPNAAQYPPGRWDLVAPISTTPSVARDPSTVPVDDVLAGTYRVAQPVQGSITVQAPSQQLTPQQAQNLQDYLAVGRNLYVPFTPQQLAILRPVFSLLTTADDSSIRSFVTSNAAVDARTQILQSMRSRAGSNIQLVNRVSSQLEMESRLLAVDREITALTPPLSTTGSGPSIASTVSSMNESQLNQAKTQIIRHISAIEGYQVEHPVLNPDRSDYILRIRTLRQRLDAITPASRVTTLRGSGVAPAQLNSEIQTLVALFDPNLLGADPNFATTVGTRLMALNGRMVQTDYASLLGVIRNFASDDSIDHRSQIRTFLSSAENGRYHAPNTTAQIPTPVQVQQPQTAAPQTTTNGISRNTSAVGSLSAGRLGALGNTNPVFNMSAGDRGAGGVMAGSRQSDQPVSEQQQQMQPFNPNNRMAISGTTATIYIPVRDGESFDPRSITPTIGSTRFVINLVPASVSGSQAYTQPIRETIDTLMRSFTPIISQSSPDPSQTISLISGFRSQLNTTLTRFTDQSRTGPLGRYLTR